MMKPTKCKVCGKTFERQRVGQKTCSVQCAIVLARAIQARLEKTLLRAERKADKEKLKTKADWMREAQAVFNKYIRERDRDLPCISCGRHHAGQYHAGHYRATKAAPGLRFDEQNCHKQCSVCNNHMSGNILEYRINLIKKIGIEAVEKLEGPHEPKRYTVEDLQAIIRTYKGYTKGSK
jgi:predicted nucleic acid-binding Zn ribbon protein